MPERDFRDEFTLTMLPENKVHIVFREGSRMEGTDVDVMLDTYRKIARNGKIYVLSDNRGLGYVDIKTRRFVQDGQADHLVAALAILVDNGISRVIGNFLLGVNKPSFPVRLVSSEADGWKYLDQKINQAENE